MTRYIKKYKKISFWRRFWLTKWLFSSKPVRTEFYYEKEGDGKNELF
jgi:hypothetical protein